ncbi:MAG TPA: AraC family transcriptional regulator [Sandaracinaceae bacterium LLY-WYZ-13_1]|nr:AraC family transcriptional regulator [Sandaracinaceae bacterium LLY-WYZ-13_1]
MDEVTRGASGGARWEVATRRPQGSLAPHVRRLQGYDERTDGILRRRELPGPRVVAIVELGPPLKIHGREGAAPSRFRGGFVAGIDAASTLTEHDGWQRGVQIDLSPTSARRLFGVSMHELAHRVTPLEDLLRPEHRTLPEALADAPTWTARMDRAERWVAAEVSRGPRPDRRVAHAVACIDARGGDLDIGALQRAVGVSRKHLVALFREHVGVPPKVYARLVRLERLVERVRDGGEGWASLAAELGFSDQPHLAREVRALTGMTPTALASLLRATPDAFAG